jgi:predicted nucleic acid-binding protein
MAERFLIDTSVVIKYLKESLTEKGLKFLDSILNDESNISFISEIELQAWSPSNETDLDVYKMFVSNSNVIGVYPNIIAQTIQIRKQYKVKLPDALIAATAIVNNMTLVADNDKDFLRVPELNYINPAKL